MKLLRQIYNYINESYGKKIVTKSKSEKTFEKMCQYAQSFDRVFIIGNGPSLTVDDLKLLKNELTFVSNGFYNFYSGEGKQIYFCQDPTVLKGNLATINNCTAKYKMLSPHIKIRGIHKDEKTIFYSAIRGRYYKNLPPFISESFSKGLCDGYTVTFSMIQTAILCGFKKIYLLGIDFNYIIKDGKIDIASYPQGMSKTNVIGGLPNLNYNLLAFEAANDYCKEHKIEIINLSRQTKLDIFDKDILENIINVGEVK